MVLKRFSVVFSMFWTLYWIRFGPLWILKYIGDVWGSVAHVGFFLWFPVVFDGFKAVFSGFKSVVNNLLMIKHLKIYAFCFLCTLKFLGTGWARSPAFWVCLSSTLLRQLASLSSSFLMQTDNSKCSSEFGCVKDAKSRRCQYLQNRLDGSLWKTSVLGRGNEG